MVVCAYYDLEGNIHSLVTVNDPEGKGVMLAPQPALLYKSKK